MDDQVPLPNAVPAAPAAPVNPPLNVPPVPGDGAQAQAPQEPDVIIFSS